MMKTFVHLWAVIVAATVSSACHGSDAETSAPAVTASAPASAPSIESELVTFRSGMKAKPVFLAGPPSQDSLIRLFVTALANGDTAGLDRLQLTREEFAFLYYPESRMARPPYELGPELMWTQIASRRDRGLRRLVAAYGGRKLRIEELKCQPPQRENAVVIHQCGMRPPGEGEATVRQLFGSIIERDGRFKFVGYSNRL